MSTQGPHFRSMVKRLLRIKDKKTKKGKYHVVWKVVGGWENRFKFVSAGVSLHFFSNTMGDLDVHVLPQVLDTQKFGLPQRRRRLYVLGSPKCRPAPVMRSSTGKAMPLESFISVRQKEKMPSNMLSMTLTNSAVLNFEFDTH